MQFKQKNVATMLVAKNVARTGTVVQNAVVSPSIMADGEIAVVTPAGKVIDKDALSENFKFVVKRPDGTLKFSDMINAKSVQRVTVERYAAGTNQVDYIGYNGTSGAIDVIDNNTYKINITLRGTDALDASRMTIKHGVYSSDDSATEAEIAAGLTKSLITNFSREAIKLKYGTDLIKFEMVNAGTSTATSGGALTVINGSKYVTILGTGSNAGKYNSNAATIVAGDYIRFGHDTTKTYPVYKVDEVVSGGGATTMVVKLNIPYQGTTNTALAAASVGVIPAADLSTFGIKMTGCEYPYLAYKLSYGRSTWTMGLQDFGSTTITNSTKMSLGTGYGKMVNELESWIALNRDNWYLNTVAVTYPTLDSSTASTAYYALIHFQYTNEDTTDMGNTNKFHKELWIACPMGTATTYTGTDTSIGTVIDTYASTYGWNISYGTGTNGVANTTTAKAIESGAGA